jgi:hypothetical protein
MDVTFNRAGIQANPWDTPQPPISFTLTAIDMGIRQIYADNTATEGGNRTSAVRRVRMLMVDATGLAPAVGDRVTIGGKVHDVLEVRPLAPSGAALYYEVEIST